jgi:CelD/BcsL family acetyltransferase involved in cellulose biosynthesis
VGEAAGALVLLGLLVPHRRRELGGLIRVDALHLHATGRAAMDVIAQEYNGFLVDRAWAGKAERAAASWLLGFRTGRRRFDELHVKDATEARAEALAAPESLVRVLSRKPSWQVDLRAVRAAPEGAFLNTISANTRYQIRRSLKLYGARGKVAATAAPDADTALTWLDQLARLHQEQWTARGQPGGWAFPFFAGFQRRLVAACVPAGKAEIVRVSAGEEVVGYVYNLISGGHVMAFVSGFAFDSDARLKPGLMSHALCIQLHADAGRERYDFLAGAYRYKASLGTPGPAFVHLQMQRATPMTRMERGVRAVWEGVRGRRR